MSEKRIKSTPGGAGDTSCARPANDNYRSNKLWDGWEERKRKEKEDKQKE